MTGLLNSPWGLARKCPRRSAGCSGSRSYPVAERTARILVHCAIGRLPADGSDQLHRRRPRKPHCPSQVRRLSAGVLPGRHFAQRCVSRTLRLRPGYLLLDILKAHPKGSVFLALDLRAQSEVGLCVLKQGRQFYLFDSFGRDMRTRLRHQAALSSALSLVLPTVSIFRLTVTVNSRLSTSRQ